MSDSQLLARACNDASTFPRNSVRSRTSRYHLEGYLRRLNEHSRRLFVEDGSASLHLWEYNDNVKEFKSNCFSSTFELKIPVQGETLYAHDDPRCRFIFIHAPNSRERLRMSREMFNFILTYHQVMPNFLEFIFPFGHQGYAEDFLFSGFREDTRLSQLDGGLIVPQLGRSGREIRMCYSLKSVEMYDTNPSWPWSVRQTTLYHSFDIVTGKATWIVVKGSHLIRERVESATAGSNTPSELSSFDSTADSFASALAMHLILCEWCDEDWRWYLTFLEKRLQNLTRRTFTVDIPKASSFVEPDNYQKVQQRNSSFRRTLSTLTKSTGKFSKRFSRSGSTPGKTKFQPSFPQPPMLLPMSLTLSPIDQSRPRLPPVLPPGVPGSTLGRFTDKDEIYSAKTLQQVQDIEDKANEVLLVLEANTKIVELIRNHYEAILNSEECPADIRSGCKPTVVQFRKRMDNIIADLGIQHSSAHTLLRLLENRKSLLSGLLNFRNIEANKELSMKTQHSTKKMEKMTEAMHLIAIKTKEETVSMRIITLVTLFFLPGTFISTIMSTDIIRFQAPQDAEGRIFQPRALELYLAITVPMMTITFAAWGIVYWWVKRRQEDKAFGGRFSGWLP